MFTISSNITLAQKQGDVWCFGDSAGVDFSNEDNPIVFKSGIDGRGSCSSVSTEEGQLLFYCGNVRPPFGGPRKCNVYNVNHEIMPHGDSLIGEDVFHEQTIVPKPGSNHLYYIIQLDVSGVFPEDTIYEPVAVGIYYSIVDMLADSGKGDVISKNNLLYINNSTSQGDKFMNDNLMAFRHGNGRDWWLFDTQYNFLLSDTAYFLKHLVTPNGIELIEKERFSYTPDTTKCIVIGKNVLSPDGNRLMILSPAGKFSEYLINRCTGEFELERLLYLTEYNQITYQPLNGLAWQKHGEYSPNGKLFYINKTPVEPNDEIVCTVQINLNDIEPLSTMDTIFSEYEPFDYANEDYDGEFAGDMKLAPDGKIYWSTWAASGLTFNWPYPDTALFTAATMNLSVINNPDSIGDACNAEPFSLYLNGNRTYVGIPNNPNYRLGPLDGSPCDTLGINALQEIKPNNRPRAFTYPNPAKETVWLSIGEKAFKAGANPPKVTLYDINGKKIFETKVQQLPVQLNIGKLPSGIYSGRLTFSGAEYYFKLVKE